MIGPKIPPKEPPTAINPKSRLPCSVVNRSVMNPQKTAVEKRLNTLTTTKKKTKPSQRARISSGFTSTILEKSFFKRVYARRQALRLRAQPSDPHAASIVDLWEAI